MKRLIVGVLFCICCATEAQVLAVIQQGVKKAIVAADLKIQRLQNKVIWQQNAQKVIENTLSKLHLEEIKVWMERQRQLYADYFEELRVVKTVLQQFSKVKHVLQQQGQLVTEFKEAWTLFKKDPRFTSDELSHMLDVYTGMIRHCSQQADRLFTVIRSYATQMSDASRLTILNDIAKSVEEVLLDLKAFNEENKLLSLQRVTDQHEIEYVRKLYGL